MIQLCRLTGRRFLVSEAEQQVLRRIGTAAPFIGEPLPLPRVLPAEIVRAVFSYGSVEHVHWTKSALSGRPILSRYNPLSGYRVVSVDEYWSDDIDNTRYGRDYDFTRTFFDQFADLMRDCYHPALSNLNCENCSYSNGLVNCRNCYLSFSGIESQDLLYCHSHYYGHDCIDCVGCVRTSFSYGCTDCDNCYECQELTDCHDCSSCYACLDCRSCSSCTGCVGLSHRRYCWLNEQLTQEEYQRLLAEYPLGSFERRSALFDHCRRFIVESRHQPQRIANAEDCTGAYIARCNNMLQCYHAWDSQDCGFAVLCHRSHDAWKCFAFDSGFLYAAAGVRAQNSGYSYYLSGGELNFYSHLLFRSCANCFGCANLIGRSYCVLNKQYTHADFMELVPRIIRHMQSTGEWGESLPPANSPYFHREDFSQPYVEQLPLDQQIQRGYRQIAPTPAAPAERGCAAGELPDHIGEIKPDEWVGRKIADLETGRVFGLQKQELEFYKRNQIPLPRRHWRERLNSRLDGRDRLREDAGTV